MSPEPRKDRIALVGAFGSGKTSISKAWAEMVNGRQFEFSDPGKDETARALAINAVFNEPDGFSVERFAQTFNTIRSRMDHLDYKDEYRRVLQVWLTEFRRYEDPEYWVNRARDLILSHSERISPIATVFRFPNELRMLREEGFTIIRLESGPTVRDQGKLSEHDSEQYWQAISVDVELSYEEGVEHQARRLIQEFGINGFVYMNYED